jgi:hypothetical protein
VITRSYQKSVRKKCKRRLANTNPDGRFGCKQQQRDVVPLPFARMEVTKTKQKFGLKI